MSVDCGAILVFGKAVSHHRRHGDRDYCWYGHYAESGIRFTSKKILQWAVVLLGFGMNLAVIVVIY